MSIFGSIWSREAGECTLAAVAVVATKHHRSYGRPTKTLERESLCTRCLHTVRYR